MTQNVNESKALDFKIQTMNLSKFNATEIYSEDVSWDEKKSYIYHRHQLCMLAFELYKDTFSDTAVSESVAHEYLKTAISIGGMHLFRLLMSITPGGFFNLETSHTPFAVGLRILMEDNLAFAETAQKLAISKIIQDYIYNSRIVVEKFTPKIIELLKQSSHMVFYSLLSEFYKIQAGLNHNTEEFLLYEKYTKMAAYMGEVEGLLNHLKINPKKVLVKPIIEALSIQGVTSELDRIEWLVEYGFDYDFCSLQERLLGANIHINLSSGKRSEMANWRKRFPLYEEGCLTYEKMNSLKSITPGRIYKLSDNVTEYINGESYSWKVNADGFTEIITAHYSKEVSQYYLKSRKDKYHNAFVKGRLFLDDACDTLTGDLIDSYYDANLVRYTDIILSQISKDPTMKADCVAIYMSKFLALYAITNIRHADAFFTPHFLKLIKEMPEHYLIEFDNETITKILLMLVLHMSHLPDYTNNEIFVKRLIRIYELANLRDLAINDPECLKNSLEILESNCYIIDGAINASYPSQTEIFNTIKAGTDDLASELRSISARTDLESRRSTSSLGYFGRLRASSTMSSFPSWSSSGTPFTPALPTSMDADDDTSAIAASLK